MYLQDIKFVDLRHSDWDKEKSKRETGEYIFDNKVYLKYRKNPAFHLAWCRYNPHSTPPYADLWEWQVMWGYTPVTTMDDYWPEGIPPNADGKYVNGDLILVKTPMKNYLKKRADEMGASENASKAIINQFYNESKAMGMDVSKDTLQQILSSR